MDIHSTIFKQLVDGLRAAWSVTGFAAEEVALYAQRLTLQDARQGLMVLSVLLFALYGVEIAFHVHFGLEELHIYTLGLLGILCAHVALSTRALQDIKSIYLLGVTLLMVSGTAFILLAHHAASLSIALFASVTLLFMVIPLIPWGLREGLMVVILIYGTFTVSTWSAPTGFDPKALWALQFIMLSAGLVSLALVTRNASVRKADIRVRFDLEKAHHTMMHLSHKDPLTGAWNRRYLNSKFDSRMAAWQAAGETCHFALLDIDNFKPLNDSFGHDYGDMVLRCVVDGFGKVIEKKGFVVRMGGDEFALLFVERDPEALIEAGVKAVRGAQSLKELKALPLAMSVGLVSIPPDSTISQSDAYREADIALYEAKERKARYCDATNLVMRVSSTQPQRVIA